MSPRAHNTIQDTPPLEAQITDLGHKVHAANTRSTVEACKGRIIDLERQIESIAARLKELSHTVKNKEGWIDDDDSDFDD